MTSATSAPNMYGVIKGWSQYQSYYQSMHSYAANGDTTGLENVKSQLANEVVNVYLNDGDDSTNIDYEGALSFVNMAYAQYSSANPVQRNTSANTGNTGSGATGTGNNFNTSAPTGMTAGVVDWGTYDTQIQVMYARLMGNNEEEALAMRQQMATSIMDAYNSDDDEANNITMEQALSYVDARYQQVTGMSIVGSIQETTKNSFWNYVPIINLFTDETSAEDLYKIMEGEDPENIKHQDNKKNGWGVAGTLAGYTAIGAGVGSVVPVVGTAVGAGVGFVVGAACEIIDWFC